MPGEPKVKFAAILAGGKGTRLKPLTDHLPKPLAPVAGHPFLYWQIKHLQKQGITDVLLLTAYLHEKIEEFVATNPFPGLKISISIEPQPLGTGGALVHGKHLLPEVFFLINGDSFCPTDLEPIVQIHQSRRAEVTMAVFGKLHQVPVPGNIQFHENLVTSYKKGAGSELGYHWVDAGVYLMNRSLLDRSKAKVFNVEDLWPDLIQQKRLLAAPIQEPFFDIGTLDRLKYFEERVHDYF